MRQAWQVVNLSQRSLTRTRSLTRVGIAVRSAARKHDAPTAKTADHPTKRWFQGIRLMR